MSYRKTKPLIIGVLPTINCPEIVALLTGGTSVCPGLGGASPYAGTAVIKKNTIRHHSFIMTSFVVKEIGAGFYSSAYFMLFSKDEPRRSLLSWEGCILFSSCYYLLSVSMIFVGWHMIKGYPIILARWQTTSGALPYFSQQFLFSTDICRFRVWFRVHHGLAVW